MENHRKNIMLHIGLCKTGSTFIQNHYRSVKLDNYIIFLEESEIVKLILSYLENPNTEIKEKILNIIQNENSKKILISSENIFGDQFTQFKDSSKRFQLLEELFNQPKYIIFFREPSSIIYSVFFQRLHKTHALKFEDFISKNKNDLLRKSLDSKIYNYNNIFKDYLNIQNRVLLVEYEKFFKPKEIQILSYIYKDYTKFRYDFTKVTNFTLLRNLTHIFSFEKYILRHKNSKKNFFQNIKYLILRFAFFIIIFLKLEFLLKNKHLS